MTQTTQTVYLIQHREVKDNGRPFPFNHCEVVNYWLNANGQWVRTKESAERFTDRSVVNRTAKLFHGQIIKTTFDALRNEIE